MGKEDPQQFEIMFEAEVAKVAARINSRISSIRKWLHKIKKTH